MPNYVLFRWLFNPALLTIVNTTNMTIQNGDFVFVNESYEKVKSLQDSAHGGWNEKMRKTLGEAGVVTQVRTNGRIRVKVGSRSWIYNKLALTLVAKSGKFEALQRSTQNNSLLCTGNYEGCQESS
ncbi:hypothetical protein NP493_2955g00000 [Ridgeia piscesae]|uniref:Mind bomb SH3 repeat domain-containing protein n=1 Tax=Ridgeia piscesae TaxID=27915 RepID=A0AAD9JAL9_RIDPI|nr:hypothetical protein NP493_2955g00000 [Ridgeia piscesae]